jgi:hypothetical protein
LLLKTEKLQMVLNPQYSGYEYLWASSSFFSSLVAQIQAIPVFSTTTL